MKAVAISLALLCSHSVHAAFQKGKHMLPPPLPPWHVPGHRALQVGFLSRATLQQLQKAILEGADVNAPLELGKQPMASLWTPLYWAAYRADQPKMELLLRHHANVSAKSKFGVSVLWVAATSGNTKGVKMLLDHGAKARQKNVQGSTLVDTVAAIASRSSSPRFGEIVAELRAYGG